MADSNKEVSATPENDVSTIPEKEASAIPKFNVGDIIMSSGKKYHIYSKPHWNKQYNCLDYPVDYGLGCTSEGFLLEGNIRLATEKDNLIAL